MFLILLLPVHALFLFLGCACIDVLLDSFSSSSCSLIKYVVRVNAEADMPDAECRQKNPRLVGSSVYVIPHALIQPQCSALYRPICQLCLFTVISLILLFFSIVPFTYCSTHQIPLLLFPFIAPAIHVFCTLISTELNVIHTSLSIPAV